MTRAGSPFFRTVLSIAAGTLLAITPISLGQEQAPATAPAAPQAAQLAFPAGQNVVFSIRIDPSVRREAYSGRVYVVIAPPGPREPKDAMNDWFGGPQVISFDVSGVKPGEPIRIPASALGFPKPIAEVPAGTYRVQAVARVDLDSPKPGQGVGDLYSETADITFPASAPPEFTLTKAVESKPFKESERVRLVEIESPLLSKFYGRPVKTRAGVVLPVGWTDDATKKYPTVYFIHGFGGDHTSAEPIARQFGTAAQGCIIVVPDPSCLLGHSVFADSANNGPRGSSFIEELVPAVESKFHGSGDGSNRYITGVSSGGWSSIWLQITYPDQFAGTWSHVPDPVDFRDFQRIDLYAPGANMFKTPAGERRGLARQNDQVIIWYDDFIRQESVMGDGGQIHSFEAVFSPKGANGQPLPLFDRATGNVDPAVAKTWEAYDIRLILERNWSTLGPKLAGKLHIFAGEKDTFFLEGATRLLKDSLAKLGSDAQVEIVPGMVHQPHRAGIEAMFKTIEERQKK